MKKNNPVYAKSRFFALVWLFVLFILTPFSNLLAQKNNSAKNVGHAVTQLYEAMIQNNEKVLKDLTSEDLTYGHSSGKVENKSEYIDGVMNGAFQFSAISPVDQTIQTSGDIAVVRHIFKGEGTNNGSQAKVNIGCMLVFQKQDKDWKLLARQAFKL
ncbi:nuclear transport factor 2 family protein [Flavimarina sp. Hel_I_48]|uniref:nuclear transport factor 2 family protein n=1 Tax=Flavimarina sp. Hel_I_48 TaxID=1392488 RepID=UPI000689B027|nr:nuclear transport factor 2 family protein [Flavimarina sp. Hel_I_48]